MSIADEIAALQTLHLSITGVKTADTAYPTELLAVNLPQVVVLPSEAQWSRETFGSFGSASGGIYSVSRLYIVRVYVSPVSFQEDFNAGAQDTISLLETFGQAYMEHTNIATEAGVYYVLAEISDVGLRGNLKWNPASTDTFHGFEFRVRLEEVDG